MNCYKLSIKLIIFSSIFFLHMKSDEIMTITRTEQIKLNAGKIVRIVGIYRELNVAKAVGKTLYDGRAYIELEDGGSIALDRDKEGIRSIEEIKEHKNKKVVARGILLPIINLWGDGSEATITMPCVMFCHVMSEETEKLLTGSNVDNLPIVTNKNQLTELDGLETKITGIYRRREIKKLVPHGKNPDGSFIYGGIIGMYAYIQLHDNTSIMLGIGAEVFRSDWEIEKYKNKKVSIIGALHKEGWKLVGDIGKTDIAYLDDIKNIEFADSNQLPTLISIDFITHNFTYSNTDELDSQRVQIEGIYTQEEVEKKKYHRESTDPPHYTGQVCIQLADSSKIFLETGKKGIRSTEEIRKFENKKIIVIGTLYKNHGLFDGPENMNVTCIKNIESIELKNDD